MLNKLYVWKYYPKKTVPKTILIAGATDGTGFETAKILIEQEGRMIHVSPATQTPVDLNTWLEKRENG